MTRRSLRTIGAAAAALLLLGPAAVELYTDWLWFGETGHQSTFLRIVTSRAGLGVSAFAVVFAVLYFNCRIALTRFPARRFTLATREGPISLSLNPRLARTVAIAVSGVFALLIALYASSRWLDW